MIFGQTCKHFSPQYNSETAGLLATKSGMALGIHLKNLAHVVRPRPRASVVALATLERRGDCGNTMRKQKVLVLNGQLRPKRPVAGERQ